MISLVLGAAGFLGTNLVDALLAQGIVPRCGRRLRTNVLALRKRKVPLVLADLDSTETLVTAMTDCDVVFHLAGHYPRFSIEKDKTLALAIGQMDRVLEAAATAKIKRLIYVSSTATVAPRSGRASTESDVFDSPPGFGTYHDLKWALEDRVNRNANVESITVCPSACLGPWDLRVGTSAMLVATARGMRVPHPDGIVSWVDARDVATALVRLAAHPSPPKRLIVSGGQTSMHAFLCDAAQRYGVLPPPAALSVAEAEALADAQEAHALQHGGRAALSRELVDLIAHGVELDASLSRASISMSYRPLDETLDAFDVWARRMQIIPPIHHAQSEPEEQHL